MAPAGRRPPDDRPPATSPPAPTNPARTDLTLSVLETVLDAAGDGVLVVDAAQRIVRLNRRALELLGHPTRSPATTAEVRALLRPTDTRGAPIDELAADLALAGRVVEREALVEVAGGPPRRLHARSAPIYAADGRVIGAVSIWRDITELHETIAARAALVGARLTARRVVHEIGNALQSLLVHAELGQSRPAGVGQAHWTPVLRDARRIGELLGRLRRLDRATRIEMDGQDMLDLDAASGPVPGQAPGPLGAHRGST